VSRQALKLAAFPQQRAQLGDAAIQRGAAQRIGGVAFLLPQQRQTPGDQLRCRAIFL